MAVSDAKKHDQEVGYPLSKIQAEDIRHAHAASIHGFIYNALAPTTAMNWGFSPKDTDVSRMRILVSYGSLFSLSMLQILTDSFGFLFHCDASIWLTLDP